jgi:signal transduction histidine kinase
LIAKKELLGVIAFYTRERYSFSDDESEFLITLAGQAAIAIHNATLYEQVKKQMLELEKSNKVKDEFLSVISHELRTPLNVTMGYTALLKEGALGPINTEQATALEKVTTHTKDLLKMIDGILCVRSLEANAVEVWIEEVNVGNLLDELKADYAMSLGRDVQLLCDYPAGLPMLKTDHAKLKQILQNLVHNAVKFTQRGRITVRGRYLKESKIFEFEVSDTGVGIFADKLPIIFEMFRQVDSSDTRSHEGVGLGLYIVKKFTEMLGGQVSVKSQLHQGSTFTVRIPSK